MRGTTWRWTWGTLWLTTSFRARKGASRPEDLPLGRRHPPGRVQKGAEQPTGELVEGGEVGARDHQSVTGEDGADVEEGQEVRFVEDHVGV